MTRRNRSLRCPTCLIPQAFCVCQVAAPESVPTRVSMVIHFSDASEMTNTGKLIPLVLANSEVFIRGLKESPLAAERTVLADYHNLLLFPSTDSKTLTPAYLAGIEQPINLIVPDGNWNQAGKMVRREKPWRDLPRVHLNITKPSRYRLRTPAFAHWISTFEAVARSLGVLENEGLQERLEYFFEVVVERILFLKGKLPSDQVTGGMMQEMIRQHHADNGDHTFLNSKNRRDKA